MYRFSCWLPDRIPKDRVCSSVCRFIEAHNVAFAAIQFADKLKQENILLDDGERLCVSDATGYIHFGDITLTDGTYAVEMHKA